MKIDVVRDVMAVVGLSCSSVGLGQTTPVAPDVTGNAEIVISAQRRLEVAQDVPIALSVVGAADLATRGITTVNQLQDATPNLEIEPAFGGGAPQFRLRGVGFQDYASNNSPTVGVYVNEIAYPVPIMTQGLLYDIARVEILRGPQGTLYGRNTTGGAISIVTNKPTDTFAIGGSIEYGRFDALKTEGYANTPLADGAALRIAATTEQGGGFQHNRADGRSLGDADRWGIRALLKLGRDGPLGALLDIHYARDRSEAIGLYLLNPLATRAGRGPTIPADIDYDATGWGVSPALMRDAGLTADQKPGKNNRGWGTSLNLGYDLGAVQFTSITAYETFRRREFGDWDSSASIEADTFFGSRVSVVSEEARLSSHGDGRFGWVAGVYLARQILHERYFSDFLDIYGTYGRVTYDQVVKSASIFGQADYAVTDHVKLTGGVRYEDETRDLNGFGTAFGGATALPPTSISTRMQPLTGRAALEYRANRQLMLYASASRGAKSGGFTAYNTATASAIQPFRPETLWAYEAGIKADPSRAAQINAAAYYYDYRDQQRLSAVYAANGPVGRFVNVPRSRIYGIEIEARLIPAKHLTITQYGSFKRGEYIAFDDLDVAASRAALLSVSIDRAGQRIPFPKFSYGGSIAYAVPVGASVVTASSTYSYRDRYPSWLGAKYDIAGYWLVDAQLALAPVRGGWQVALWGRNILNKQYDVTRNFFTSADIAQPGRPASYGVRLSFDR